MPFSTFLSRQLRRGWRYGRRTTNHLLAVVEWRFRERVRWRLPGEAVAARPKRLVFFAHWHPANRVTPITLDYVRQLAARGYQVVFITMCRRLAEDDLAALRSLCREIIGRRSFGRDFGAWRDGVRLVLSPADAPEEILLVNDSVIGPLFDLDELWTRLESLPGDMLGLTDSPDQGYHLQSFFLLFRGQRGVAFIRDYLARTWFTNDKFEVIQDGEIGVSRAALRKGLVTGVAYPYGAVVQALLGDEAAAQSLTVWLCRDAGFRDWLNGMRLAPTIRKRPAAVREALHLAVEERNLNPTHFFWRVLIEHFRFPFLKTELLAHNPTRVTGLDAWRSVIAGSQMTHESIEAHLRSLGPTRTS